ncbi:hypothetical protein IM753_03210 [Moraxella sp. K127]|uniref:hypothetical protein n=1 Tax=Moraxella sp. K127 TaxID=2780079 RepID=UPI001880E293|nr:hypothetical protein [Moraxella sp. K127]MBE9590000.1 hypothetical protein [Moraxella sp. K127]
MKNQSYRLINADIAQNCFKAIEQAVADTLDTPHNVVVTIGIDDDKARSNAQNRIYWGWVTAIANQTGDDKDSIHIDLKRRFLAKIYCRDFGEYADLADNMKIIKENMPEHYENLAINIVKQLSTTRASTKQFKEFLDMIYLWAYTKEIYLPIPAELAWIDDRHEPRPIKDVTPKVQELEWVR